MGLRYRKSINLGGGFRVNLSKSGIGYSWGTKGYRVTKKADGGVRKTYSIPGTGLSWTEDSKKGKRTNNNFRNAPNSGNGVSYSAVSQNVLYQATDANTKDFVTDSSKEFIDTIKKFATIRGLLKWGSIITFFIMFGTPSIAILFIIFLVTYIVFSATLKINVEYDCDEYGKRRIQMLDQAMSTLINNRMIWQILTEVATTSRKTNAGASSSVNRKQVRFIKKKPYFLKTDATCYYIKLRNDQIFVLPDRLIVKGKKGWGVVEYSELHVGVDNQVFIESEAVPKDAAVIGHTWQYVNKDGGPDKRFSNNRQFPKCNYGQLTFKSDTGLNIILYISNIGNAQKFKNLVAQMISEAKQMRIYAAQEEQRLQQIQNAAVNVPVEESAPVEVEEYEERNNFEDFVIKDANEAERNILKAFWEKIIENNLPPSISCERKKDGRIDVEYKGNPVGKFCVRGSNSWLFFLMGTSGKGKQIDGNSNELIEHVSKWIRYIINYL